MRKTSDLMIGGIVLSTIIGLLLTACKKFVEIAPAPNLIQTSDLFNSETNAESAVLGVYLQLQSSNPSMLYGTLSLYCGLSADELSTQSSILEYNAFYTNSILSNSSIVNSQLWTSSYRVIYRANAIIEGIERSTSITAAKKKQFIGEMKTIRALNYFNLVNLFGAVPLVTTTNYLANDQMPRTPVNEINKQIVNDLIDAVKNLSETYISNLRSRINKHSASALLARVYLYQKDWENAEKISSSVISSSLYNLPSDLDAVFKNNSQETIWQIAPLNDIRNTFEGSIFVPSNTTVIPTIFLSESLLNVFVENDLRKTKWVGFNTINNSTYSFPLKYKRRTPSPIDEYTVVFRLAEQYLIRSEARLELNDIEGAVSDLNIIHKRAGLPEIETQDKTLLYEAITKERQLELFSEYGHRWFDLKRTGQLNQILSSIKGADWQSTDSLYPIPLNEMIYNSALVQNPGY
jgi:hypothetical protein